MIGLLLAAAVACTAETNVPEFKDQVQRACSDKVRRVSFTGNHEEATLTFTFTAKLGEMPVAQTTLSVQTYEMAKTAHTILYRSYPMGIFRFVAKDGADKTFCEFTFEGAEEKPARAVCFDNR